MNYSHKLYSHGISAGFSGFKIETYYAVTKRDYAPHIYVKPEGSVKLYFFSHEFNQFSDVGVL